MVRKAQHTDLYVNLPPFLKAMREGAGLSQRALADRLRKPQSWVYNCETGNRRVDVTEFIAWVGACEQDATQAFRRLVERL